MRSVWKDSISFGLVYTPVAVYPMTCKEKVNFKQLRKSDLSPVRYKKVSEADDKEVPSAEIVKATASGIDGNWEDRDRESRHSQS